MHFPIIAIEPMDCTAEDFVEQLDYEDSTLQGMTDYYGRMYDEDERKEVINSSWLKDLLYGYATIDTEKETITFLDAKSIRERFKIYLRDTARDLFYKADLRKYDFWKAAHMYKDHDALFYMYGHGATSLDFIANSEWEAGKTYRIGNIFDAHV